MSRAKSPFTLYGGTLVFNGHTHEQSVHLFQVIGEDRSNHVVILTGSGELSLQSARSFDFFSPQGYDRILREGRKLPSHILDIEEPMIATMRAICHGRARIAEIRRRLTPTPRPIPNVNSIGRRGR